MLHLLPEVRPPPGPRTAPASRLAVTTHLDVESLANLLWSLACRGCTTQQQSPELLAQVQLRSQSTNSCLAAKPTSRCH
jgi:hypothetical protein